MVGLIVISGVWVLSRRECCLVVRLEVWFEGVSIVIECL